MSHILALDQGTTSSRSIVFDDAGHIVAMAQREFRQIYPQSGWVEHDPNEIWDSQLATAREALHKARLKAADIAAIGITNQRETTMLWDRRSGEPVHNAIVWMDRRGEPLCAQLREQGLEPMIQHATGLRIDSYFSATKLRWLLDHVNGAHIAAARGELAFGTIDSWLLWKLTGGEVHATDVSNASRSMLFDIRHNAWDPELLKRLHIPDSVLPKVFASSHVYGHSRAELFGAAIAIAGVAGDQQAALFGQACFAPGQAKNTYGTGCFMLMHTGDQFHDSHNGLLTTSAAQTGELKAEQATGRPELARSPSGGGRRTAAALGSTDSATGRPELARSPSGGRTPHSGGLGGTDSATGRPELALSPSGGRTPHSGGLGGKEYAFEGSVFIGGAVVQWLRDGLHAIRESGEVQALAESVDDAGGVVFVPAFAGLGAPYWQPDARGAIVGLSRGSTVAHIARAAVESIAFQSAALLQAMSRDAVAAGGQPLSELRVDGGACVNDALMQFQADLLGIPVLRPEVIETTALGAASLAGLAAGVWRDRDQLAAMWKLQRRFEPKMSRDQAAQRMTQWEQAVRRVVMV